MALALENIASEFRSLLQNVYFFGLPKKSFERTYVPIDEFLASF